MFLIKPCINVELSIWEYLCSSFKDQQPLSKLNEKLLNQASNLWKSF